MRSPIPVLNHTRRGWRGRRLNIPPRGLDIPKRFVPRLRGMVHTHGHRNRDEALPLNVYFFFVRMRLTPAMAATAAAARFGGPGRLDGRFYVHGDDVDLGFWFRRRGETWRRRRRTRLRLFYRGAGLHDDGRRRRRRGGRRRDDARDMAARGEDVGFWAGEVQPFLCALTGCANARLSAGFLFCGKPPPPRNPFVLL